MDDNNRFIGIIIIFYSVLIASLLIFDIIIKMKKVKRIRNYYKNKSIEELKQYYEDFYHNKDFNTKTNKRMKKEFYNNYILPKKNN